MLRLPSVPLDESDDGRAARVSPDFCRMPQRNGETIRIRGRDPQQLMDEGIRGHRVTNGAGSESDVMGSEEEGLQGEASIHSEEIRAGIARPAFHIQEEDHGSVVEDGVAWARIVEKPLEVIDNGGPLGGILQDVPAPVFEITGGRGPDGSAEELIDRGVINFDGQELPNGAALGNERFQLHVGAPAVEIKVRTETDRRIASILISSDARPG